MSYVITSLITSFIAIAIALYFSWREYRINIGMKNVFIHRTTYGEFLMFCVIAMIPLLNVFFILQALWCTIKPNLEFLSKPIFEGKED